MAEKDPTKIDRQWLNGLVWEQSEQFGWIPGWSEVIGSVNNVWCCSTGPNPRGQTDTAPGSSRYRGFYILLPEFFLPNFKFMGQNQQIKGVPQYRQTKMGFDHTTISNQSIVAKETQE